MCFTNGLGALLQGMNHQCQSSIINHCCRYGKLAPGDKNYRMTDAQYKAEHGLVLQGDAPLPEALQTFESVGFPHDIMDEVLPDSHIVPSAEAHCWRCLRTSGGGCSNLLAAERIGLLLVQQHASTETAQPAAPFASCAPCTLPTARGSSGWQSQQLVAVAAA
jgi:hypothetical protein